MVVTNLIAANQTAFSYVILYRKTIRAGIKIDAESAVVGGIGSWGGLFDVVVGNHRMGLVAQRIDTAGIIELAGIVLDDVFRDAVVLHTCVERCPSPTDADARVVDTTYVVSADGAVAYIAQRNGHSSPVLSGGIDDEVLLNG